jgi:hypothetical protein
MAFLNESLFGTYVASEKYGFSELKPAGLLNIKPSS